jgi:hypothetical protein
MTRAAAGVALAGLVFAIHAAWIALADARGALSPEVVGLWGEAIAAAEGATPVGRVATFHPPLPLLLSAAWERLAGLPGLPTPSAVAAALIAALGALWWGALRRGGLGRGRALAAAALLVLHPLTFWMIAQGPGPVLVAAGLFGLAVGLARLRWRGAAPDAALAAGSLALLALGDGTGLLFALAAAPVVVIAAPPEMLARSPLGMLLILLFPLLAMLAGMALVALVFGGDPAAPFAALLGGVGVLMPGGESSLGFAVLALAAGLPVLLALPLVAAGMPPLRGLALALAGLAGGAVLLRAAMGGGGEGLAAVAPALGLAAAAAVLMARDAALPRRVLPLLVLGAAGGAAALALLPEPGAARVTATLTGAPPPATPEIDALGQLARVIDGRSEVLVDVQGAPALVALRGTSAGLIPPWDPRFALAALRRRLDAPLVAVRGQDDGGARRDLVSIAFPQLHPEGAEGYALAWESGPWRLYMQVAGALPEGTR